MASGLQGIESKDFLFVNGTQVRDFVWLLPDIAQPPLTTVAPEIIQRYVEQSDPTVRHYKWIKVFNWQNELVISYFLRFSLQGDHLFVEVNRFLLGPIKKKYHAIDNSDAPDGFGEKTVAIIAVAIFAALSVPFVAIRDGAGLVAKGWSRLWVGRTTQQTAEDDEAQCAFRLWRQYEFAQ